MMFAVAVALFLAQSLASSPAGTTEVEYRVMPLTEVEAAEEFGRTCVAGWPDLAQLEAALEASPRAYERLPNTLGGLRSNWRADFGEIAYVQAYPAGRGLHLPQCNMTAFTRQAVDEGALREAIGAMLSRRLGQQPAVAGGERDIVWSWEHRGRRTELRRIRLGPQQIELSLQNVSDQP